MADASKRTNEEGDNSKQTFVPKGDRPEVRLTLDTPLSELRVRDLRAILGSAASKNPFEVGKTSLTDFFGKADFEVIKEPEPPPKGADTPKDPKSEKAEKAENDKSDKEWRDKSYKEWREATRGQRYLIEASELNPGMEQMIHALTGLTEQVSQLADQVAELRRKDPEDL